LAPFGRLLQATPPSANSTRTANEIASRGLRLYIHMVPPSVMPSRNSPSPPPNPPGFGTAAFVLPVQNVFTTNATCVGPFGVKFTDAGSGTQLIEGAGAPLAVVTEHPNVTVPLKPSVAVSTIPTASFPPGGTGGNVPPIGGVTTTLIGEFDTVSVVEPIISVLGSCAEIVVLKSAVDPVVASPLSLIVAASPFEELHPTSFVMSFVLLSEKVPVAWNCSDELIGSVGFAGVTAMDFSVGALSVNVAVTIVVVAGIVNEQVVVALSQMALQLVKVEFAPGIAVSVTCVPADTLTVHPLAEPLVQLIPLPVTVPVPVPAVCTTN